MPWLAVLAMVQAVEQIPSATDPEPAGRAGAVRPDVGIAQLPSVAKAVPQPQPAPTGRRRAAERQVEVDRLIVTILDPPETPRRVDGTGDPGVDAVLDGARPPGTLPPGLLPRAGGRP